MLCFAQDGLKGAAGSKNSETDKSGTMPVKDGDAPPPKPVSSIQMFIPFITLHF